MTHDEAVKVADEVFGPVEPGAPESPHAIKIPVPAGAVNLLDPSVIAKEEAEGEKQNAAQAAK